MEITMSALSILVFWDVFLVSGFKVFKRDLTFCTVNVHCAPL